MRHIYRGGDLEVGAGVMIPGNDLSGLEGKEIITSDGTSLLGADDKAGAAAMVEVLEYLHCRTEFEHGPISFWFCVDEEIGELDVSVIPEEIVKSWDVLWTLDGERLGLIDVGCFVCRKTEVVFKGTDAHPGVYGKKLLPAHLAACTFVAEMTESRPTPMQTSGQESFHYAANIEGNATKTTVVCIPRTFDPGESELMVGQIKAMAGSAAEKFGVTFEIEDRVMCHNTRGPIEKSMSLVRPGIDALEAVGYTVKLEDVRGGTDGAMANMHFPDLPAPNMGTGSANLHGPQEFLVVDELITLCHIVTNMIGRYHGLEV